MSLMIKSLTDRFNQILLISNQIDMKNQKILHDEKEKERLCREATEACLTVISEHLYDFLCEGDNSNARYEDWLHECHPENCEGCVDHRFYVRESDHRILWNKMQERRHRVSLLVQPRTSQ